LVATCLLLAFACSKDPVNPDIQDKNNNGGDDVGGYLAGLPSWEEFCPPPSLLLA